MEEIIKEVRNVDTVKANIYLENEEESYEITSEAYYAVDAMKKVLAARKLLEKEMNKEEGNADNG